MDTYRLTPDSFGVIRKNLFEKCFGTCLALVFVLSGVSLFLFNLRPFITLWLALGLVVLITLFYLIMLHLHKKDMSTFEIIICEETIKRKLAQFPDTEISRDEVRGIQETDASGLLITTDDCYRYIFVPYLVENYDEVRDKLREWKRIKHVPKKESYVIPFTVSSMVSISFMTTVISANKMIYISSGTLLILTLLFNLYQLHQKPQLEDRARRKRFVGYSLVLSSSVLILRILNEYSIWK